MCAAAKPRRRREVTTAGLRVVLFVGRGCHLCERARETLVAEGVAFDEVDITDDAGLEAAYREWLPVLEIDGERAFVYRIPVDALRRKLGAQS
jgi:glutaredoxin